MTKAQAEILNQIQIEIENIFPKYKFQPNNQVNWEMIKQQCNELLQKYNSEGNKVYVEHNGELLEVMGFEVTGDNDTVIITPVAYLMTINIPIGFTL